MSTTQSSPNRKLMPSGHPLPISPNATVPTLPNSAGTSFNFFIVKIPRIGEIVRSFSIYVWLIALGITSSRSVCVVTRGRISLLLMAKSCCIVWMGHLFFLPPSIDGRLGCLHVLAAETTAAMNIVWRFL